MNNVMNLYDYYFYCYEKAYHKTALNEKEGGEPKHFKTVDNELPEWLGSNNDFNEAKRLIHDIRIDMNKVKVNKEVKKVFNYLNRLITGISNNKVEQGDAVETLKKSMPDLTRLRHTQNIVFQNKMIQVIYQLFNSFGFNKEFVPLFSKKQSEPTEEELERKRGKEREGERQRESCKSHCGLK